MTHNTYNRREFMHLLAGGSAAILISFNTGCKSKISRWRFLNEEEISLLDAITEQIIPTDDFPGGKWANVSNFIDKQLVSYYKKHQHTYREGLASFRQSVMKLNGKKFEELPFPDQTVFLEKMEKGELPVEYWNSQSASGFFEMLRLHSLQGYYGSPIHGGNREYTSYRMLNLDYPNIMGQNRYEDLSWRIYNPKSTGNGK